jgi:hypothetical protein
MPRFSSHVARVALSVLLVAGTSHADPSFPSAVESDWKVPCLPKCTLCHLTQLGGPGNIRTTTDGSPGFGATLRDLYGLSVGNVSSIHSALAQAKAGNSDVDGDGKTDYDELSTGMDPNDPTPGATICTGDTGPVYGCVRVARPGPVDGAASTFAIATLIGLATLRRRGARRT